MTHATDIRKRTPVTIMDARAIPVGATLRARSGSTHVVKNVTDRGKRIVRVELDQQVVEFPANAPVEVYVKPGD